MKRMLALHVVLVTASATHIVPMHAMWTSSARAALRSGQFNASTRLAPAAIAGSDLLHSQPGSRLLAHTLASKRSQDYRSYNRNGQHAGSDSKSYYSNGYNWRSLFSRADRAQIFGGTILGWHLWWSDSDICQTPEDFNDTAKLQRTKEYCQAKGPGRIFEIFSDRFYYLNDDPQARDRILEFLAANFDAVKDDAKKMDKLTYAVEFSFDTINKNKWGKQLIHKLATYYSNNFSSLKIDNSAHRNLIIKIIDENSQAAHSLAETVVKNFPALISDYFGVDLIEKIAKTIKENPKVARSFTQPAIDNCAVLMTSSEGVEVISTIIEHNPESSLSQAVIANLPKQANNYWHHHSLEQLLQTISDIIKLHKSVASTCALSAVNNFDTLITVNNGMDVLAEIIKQHPENAAALTQPAVKHFAALAAEYWGNYLNNVIIIQCPQSASAFIQPALNHFGTVIAHSSGIHLIATIIEHKPERASLFAQAVADNFSALIFDYWGNTLIEKLLELSPESAALLAQPALDNFAAIVEHKKASLVSEIIKTCPDASMFTQAVIDNFSILITDHHGQNLITKIIATHPQSAKNFVDPVLDNFATLALDHCGSLLILEIIKQHPDSLKLFVQPVAENFECIIQHSSGKRLIHKIISAQPELALKFAAPVAKGFTNLITAENSYDRMQNIQFITKIIKKSPQSTNKFVKPALDNFADLIDSEKNGYTGYNLLINILQNQPAHAATFAQCALDNFPTLIANYSGNQLVEKIIKLHPQTAETFARAIAGNFSTVISQTSGILLVATLITQHPSSAEYFAQPALDNFADLIDSEKNGYTGYNLLINILQNQPAHAATFAQCALDNFATLTANYSGNQLVEKIIKLHPQTAETFARAIAGNFSTVISQTSGILLVATLITQHPSSAEYFAQPALDNFATLIANYSGNQLVEKIIKLHPQTAEPFARAIAGNFSTVISQSSGLLLVATLITQHPSFAEYFAQPALDNFAALIANYWGNKLVEKIIELEPASGSRFLKCATNHLPLLCKHGEELINKLIKQDPKGISQLIEPAKKHFAALAAEEAGRYILHTIMMHHPETISTFEAQGKIESNEEVLGIIECFKIKDTMSEMFRTAEKTQTTQHALALLNHNLDKISKFFPKNKSIFTFKNMVKEVIALESAEQKNGNYTFVHAHDWAIHFLQDLDAHLRSVVYQSPKQAISLRFTKRPSDNSKKQIDTRKQLMTQGVKTHYARKAKKQKHMIFMNYALLTNQIGSNTLQYIANSRCENPPKLLLEKVFKNLELLDYHTKYQSEIEELQRLHRDANTFGAGILFSFTPEMLKESVYVCYPGGRKRTVRIDGIGETDDVKLIIDTLRSAPEKIHNIDHMEFVFVVSKDCALNPRVQEADAYKVIPFNAADPEKMALYEQKRDELMAKIKADIEAERAAKTAQELTADNERITAMMTWYATHSCLEGCKESRVQENV